MGLPESGNILIFLKIGKKSSNRLVIFVMVGIAW
jgi:hypothetical protein